MTAELQKEIVEILYDKNSELFFNRLKSVTKSTNDENPFLLEITAEWDTDGKYAKFYELKEEVKESLLKLSLAEIIQILRVDDNSNNDVKTIKKWVTFFGVVLIIEIVIGIIVGLVIIT